jgi:MFS family permease
MQLLAPDILEEAGEISVAVTASSFAIGFLLWLLGWRGHRFWIVLAATIGAGVVGLYAAPAHRTHPLLAGLLLAIAAGALALALVRVIAFAAGGIALWIAVHALIPAWDEPLAWLLVGGLIGLFMFRIWTMVLTSSTGALLMTYSALCLAHKLGNVDVVALAENHPKLLNGTFAAIALIGVIAQFVLARRQGSESNRRESRPKSSQNQGGGLWWGRGQRSYRRAG